MLIALLAVLGVDLIVIVVLAAVVLLRRRWVSRQPGAFKGAVRVVRGQVPGLGEYWRRGYGRWVRDVLLWERAPLLLRSEFVLTLDVAGPVRAAAPGEVKRLGREVLVVPFAVEGDARIEIAAPADRRARMSGPFPVPEVDVR
ncbi:DUF2550 family protein [Streptacidiphilus sp. PB12-B1b]|uniref:DUF2550 family protein n=1 Tax=Streptacidiphilus sp. PB12-B1b TaxID=2705012 RepID=UPI0015FA9698|nr:DUF2550 family protein [Streptacidiphilus sp. PB12-B1b]QMU74621.1 DUF2550 family protein [Streptacidiphilus sp. PB12-B1b]